MVARKLPADIPPWSEKTHWDGAIATDHPNPPTIDHPATSLGPRCAIAIRPFAIISKKPKAILGH